MTPSFEEKHFNEDPVRVMARHGKSFSFASLVFRKERLRKVALLYSVCRYIDDCADELPEEESKAALAQILKNIDEPSPGSAFARSLTRLDIYKVSREHLKELIQGALFDLNKETVRTQEDLMTYCYRVAGVVGLMMCPLIGVRDRNAYRHAIDLGIAMQLTNISRDILEDAQNNRCYIPREICHQEGVTVKTLAQKGTTPLEVRRLVARLLIEADHYYNRGFAGLAYIPFRPRIVIFLAGRLYRAIGWKIRRNGYDVLQGRTSLGFLEKCIEAVKTFGAIFQRRFWKKSTPHLKQLPEAS